MKTFLIILLLTIPACQNAGAAPEVTWKATLVTQESVDSPPVAALPDEPEDAPEAANLLAAADAGADNHKVQANGCFAGYRDLGACCAPPLAPGKCDCREGKLCAKSCEYVNGVANVEVFCADGGI